MRPTPATEATIAELAERVGVGHPGAAPSVGVSSVTTAHELPRAFYEADECLRYARLASAPGVHRFSELGLHLLLLSLADRHELASFIENELGDLLKLDARGRQWLLPTLRAILECEGNKVMAARQLNIERRSLYYRLEKLSGCSAARSSRPTRGSRSRSPCVPSIYRGPRPDAALGDAGVASCTA